MTVQKCPSHVLLSSKEAQTSRRKIKSMPWTLLSWLVIVLVVVTNIVVAAEPSTNESSAFDAMFGGDAQEEEFYQSNRLLSIATKRNISIREAPAIASVIQSDEIRDMGARNLMDVMKMVPGFVITVNERGAYQFEVRGIGTTFSEKVLLMIDGHAVNKNYVGSPFLYLYQDMPVEHIERIEIVRGPGSALYGSNAFSASINIVTKKAIEANGVELKASLGSFNDKKLNAMFGKIFDSGLQLFVNAHYAQKDDSDITITEDCISATTSFCTGGPAPFSAFSLAPGEANTQAQKTNLFTELIYENWTFKGEYLETKPGDYLGFAFALAEDDSWGTLKNIWGDLTYNKKFSDKISTNVRIYYNYFEQDANLKLFPPNAPIPGSYMIGKPHVENDTYGLEVQFDYDLNQNHHLIVGTLYESTKQSNVTHENNFGGTNFNLDGASRDITALYMQDEWSYSDSLTFTGGFRYDNYSDFGSTINPRAGVVWSYNKSTDMKLLYGSAFRAPNNVELYNAGNPSVVGNPDLKPEETQTYEFELSHRMTKVLSGNISLFRNEIEDLIVVVPPMYTNLGDIRVDGMELGVNLQFSGTNYVRAAYTYQDATDKSTKTDLPSVPKQHASISINYALSPNWTAHTDLLWIGKRGRFTGDTRADVPAYTTVDAALTANDLYENISMQFTVHNLFDEQYVDPDSSGAIAFIPNDFPREGRVFMANATYKF